MAEPTMSIRCAYARETGTNSPSCGKTGEISDRLIQARLLRPRTRKRGKCLVRFKRLTIRGGHPSGRLPAESEHTIELHESNVALGELADDFHFAAEGGDDL